jgi:hypothetical protein
MLLFLTVSQALFNRYHPTKTMSVADRMRATLHDRVYFGDTAPSMTESTFTKSQKR